MVTLALILILCLVFSIGVDSEKSKLRQQEWEHVKMHVFELYTFSENALQVAKALDELAENIELVGTSYKELNVIKKKS